MSEAINININIDGNIPQNYQIKSRERNYGEVMSSLRSAFNSGKTQSVEFRERQLNALLRMLEETKEEMMTAFYKDMKKPYFEADITESEFTKNEIKYMLNNLKKWCKPENPGKNFIVNFFDKVEIHKDPYGVVLVIGAWNYPVHVTLIPAAGAIAAGNCVVIKPSEVAPHAAEYMAKYLPRYLDKECYQVILGGKDETKELLRQKFDYIFFTGSSTVGKLIHAAAAKSLTPITLELGGKNPTYLDDSITDFETAVSRILWGKLLNAGQTCATPDYVICTKQVQEKFVRTAKQIIQKWYSEKENLKKDLCRIINDSHFNRLINLLKNANIAIGGNYDFKDLFIEPTIVVDCKEDDLIMKEEIFGPVLAIFPVLNLQEAIKFINNNEKPLALYIFSNNKKDVDFLIKNTSSGDVLVNDTIMHTAVKTLPFGGVGNSGMGSYHGKYNFDTFTHKKGVLKKDFNFIAEFFQAMKYPPYNERRLKFINNLLAVRNNPFSFLGNKYFVCIYSFLIGVCLTLIIVYSTK